MRRLMGHEARHGAGTHNEFEVNPAQRTGCNSLDSIFSKAQIAIWRAFPGIFAPKAAPNGVLHFWHFSKPQIIVIPAKAGIQSFVESNTWTDLGRKHAFTPSLGRRGF
jgi:hypothetical protein